MDQDLVAYFANKRLLVETSTAWDEGRMPLEVFYYLVDELPPLQYITSVRCVLFRNKPGEMHVMAVRDATGNFHIIPGGRIKPEESFSTALSRELLEETGWTFSAPTLFCVARYRHLADQPPDYPYPYPDFLQLIYRAKADAFITEANKANGYEVESGFLPIAEAKELLEDESQLLILGAALDLEYPGGW